MAGSAAPVSGSSHLGQVGNSSFCRRTAASSGRPNQAPARLSQKYSGGYSMYGRPFLMGIRNWWRASISRTASVKRGSMEGTGPWLNIETRQRAPSTSSNQWTAVSFLNIGIEGFPPRWPHHSNWRLCHHRAMNYRHGFHAGNFADVVKHSLLAMLLEALSRKPAPWAYLDTHAGAGAYDLHSEAARRTREAEGGIGRLWVARGAARGRLPPAAEKLCDIVAGLNPGAPAGSLPRVYPGSPRVAAALARPGDRLLLAELHPEEAYLLRGELQGNKAVAVHERDGYEMLKAFTPPKERRGLVLIDPPYEKADEFETVADALVSAHGRWATGSY